MSRRHRPGKWAADKRYLRGEFENQPCMVPGCRAFRYRSRYCKKHRRYNELNGSPFMARRMMLKRHYKVERKDVERFLRRHRDHLGVRAGLAWLEGWVYNNSDEHGTTTNQHVARLREAGVQPLAILNEIAAVWLYAARHPYLDDGRPLTYALASAVLHLTPLRRRNAKPDAPWSPRITYQEITGRHRREVGETLRAALAVLLGNIARSILEQRVEDKDQRAALRTSFPRDPATGKFVKTPGAPPTTRRRSAAICTFPRDPVTGKFTKRTPPTTATEETS